MKIPRHLSGISKTVVRRHIVEDRRYTYRMLKNRCGIDCIEENEIFGWKTKEICENGRRMTDTKNQLIYLKNE